MQAYGEGFDILHASDYDLDLAAIAGMWNHGSVIRSWLLELAARRLRARGQRPGRRSPAGSPTPARAAGRWPRRSTTTCPPRSSPSASSSASAAVARRTPTPIASSPPCATSSAATRSRVASRPMATRTAEPARPQTSFRRVRRPPRRRRPTRSARACATSGCAEPCTMIICGATGDLTERKLAPALYNLLPRRVPAAGVHRRGLRATRMDRRRSSAITCCAGINKYSRNRPVKPDDLGDVRARRSSTSAATSTTRRPMPSSRSASIASTATAARPATGSSTWPFRRASTRRS